MSLRAAVTRCRRAEIRGVGEGSGLPASYSAFKQSLSDWLHLPVSEF